MGKLIEYFPAGNIAFSLWRMKTAQIWIVSSPSMQLSNFLGVQVGVLYNDFAHQSNFVQKVPFFVHKPSSEKRQTHTHPPLVPIGTTRLSVRTFHCRVSPEEVNLYDTFDNHSVATCSPQKANLYDIFNVVVRCAQHHFSFRHGLLVFAYVPAEM